MPYLRRIDATRVYSNWGPLASEFEGRIAAHFGHAEGTVASAASGTAALAGAILAVAGRASADRPLALIPALTFVATALAAEQCGYRPCFVDVDADTWLLDADRAADHPMLSQAGLVIPVAAFGRPVHQAAWLGFRQKTGVSVVIDGGASFEAIRSDPDGYVGEIPVALSFHATKSFATAEGGCVIASNTELIASVVRALNFGFFESRECRAASINGKMSEYHAAVGLAELDNWDEKRRALLEVAEAYRRNLRAAGLTNRLITAPSIASCYALFRCGTADEADQRRSNLAVANIESRYWYANGLHKHSHYASASVSACENAERIAASTIGLPVAPDLSDAAVSRVARALVRCDG